MENQFIIILIVAVLIIGGLLYFYRDAIRHTYNKKSGRVIEDVSHGIKKTTENISHAVKEVKQDLKN